jgi:hypothetical protein
MTVALAALTILVVASVAAWVVSVVFRDSRLRERAWEKKETAWALERQGLLDRLMYLVDKPWEVPELAVEPEPEQHPDDIPYDPTQRPIASDEQFPYYPAGVV